MNPAALLVCGRWQPHWTIKKYANDEDFKAEKPFEVSEFSGNCLLNEGIDEMWDLITGAGGTAFSAANTYLGVGDSSTAAAAAQTGLQASSNKKYVAVDSVASTSQKATWVATFAAADGNFAWEEFTVANGNSDAAKNLCRKTSSQGTKVSGQTWTLTLEVTLA